MSRHQDRDNINIDVDVDMNDVLEEDDEKESGFSRIAPGILIAVLILAIIAVLGFGIMNLAQRSPRKENNYIQDDITPETTTAAEPETTITEMTLATKKHSTTSSTEIDFEFGTDETIRYTTYQNTKFSSTTTDVTTETGETEFSTNTDKSETDDGKNSSRVTQRPGSGSDSDSEQNPGTVTETKRPSSTIPIEPNPSDAPQTAPPVNEPATNPVSDPPRPTDPPETAPPPPVYTDPPATDPPKPTNPPETAPPPPTYVEPDPVPEASDYQ